MNTGKKKILIISMTAGFGHIKAGQALLDYAKEYLPDIDVEHIDIITVDKFFKNYSKIYDILSRKFPLAWKIIYEYLPVFFVQKMAESVGLFNHKIKNHISQKNPDAIIFTNVIVLPIFTSYLKKMQRNIKVGVVVTDYHGHPYYKFSLVDYYFVPNMQVGKEVEDMGVAKEKIVVTGIPINPKFYIKENIEDLKLKYGINNSLPVALFIASFKASSHDLLLVVRQLLNLEPKINVVFIANGNEEFYATIKDNFLGHQRLLLVKWTNVMEEYMKLSDVVISKAGGLTVSECMSLQKPLIMVNPIPGQEEYNAEFVQKNNLGIKVRNIYEIIGVVPKMILSSKKNQVTLLPKQNPSEKIFQTIKL